MSMRTHACMHVCMHVCMYDIHAYISCIYICICIYTYVYSARWNSCPKEPDLCESLKYAGTSDHATSVPVVSTARISEWMFADSHYSWESRWRYLQVDIYLKRLLGKCRVDPFLNASPCASRHPAGDGQTCRGAALIRPQQYWELLWWRSLECFALLLFLSTQG